MIKTKDAQTKHKRIEDLTLDELDMVYSLMRVQDWPDVEIGRVYKLSVEDVYKIFDSYPQLSTMAFQGIRRHTFRLARLTAR
jgi:hypothetical protein